jgi:hypothetical protein
MIQMHEKIQLVVTVTRTSAGIFTQSSLTVMDVVHQRHLRLSCADLELTGNQNFPRILDMTKQDKGDHQLIGL